MYANNVFHTSCSCHFQKEREDGFEQGGGWVRESPEVFSNLNFPCDPLAVRNGLGFIFIFREVQVDPLITSKKSSQEPYLLFL